MKKSLIVLTMLALILILAGPASADVSERSINLVVGESQAQINDQSVTMSTPAQVVEGRTLVPLRFIGEAFGCDVQWIGDTRTAKVTLVNQTIEVPIGQNYAIINGDKTELQVPAQIINNSTLVPLRLISENLGAKIVYNEATRGIAITLQKYTDKDKGFEMIIPDGWTISKETAEEITLSAQNGLCQTKIGLADKGEGINASNFNIFAEECFKEFAGKDEMNSLVKDNIGVVGYMEDGLIVVSAYKLLDNGIYYVVFSGDAESADDIIGGQYDILTNSLQTLK